MQDPELSRLIHDSFLSPEQKKKLDHLLATTPEGDREAFLKTFDDFLAEAVEVRGHKFDTTAQSFDVVCEDADTAYKTAKAELEADAERQLETVEASDVEAHDRIWTQYDEKIAVLQKQHEDAIKKAAAAAILA